MTDDARTLTPEVADIARTRMATRYLIDTDTWCWLFTGALGDNGYGHIEVKRVRFLAHRLAYAIHIGPIPDGMTIDHLCFNPPCVNPDHMRLLTNAENAKNRWPANRSRCPKGHEFTEANTHERMAADGFPRRVCRACQNEYILPGFAAGDGDPRHGTLNGYNRGRCRCDLCADARRASYPKDAARRKERGPVDQTEYDRRYYLEVTKPRRAQRKAESQRLDKAIKPRSWQ